MVFSLFGEQFVVRTLLPDLALIKHDNGIRALDRREAMGDHQGSTGRRTPLLGRSDLVLVFVLVVVVVVVVVVDDVIICPFE